MRRKIEDFELDISFLEKINDGFCSVHDAAFEDIVIIRAVECEGSLRKPYVASCGAILAAEADTIRPEVALAIIYH